MPTLQKDLEKAMEEYKISSFADILRALRDHPDWLEELRKIILTEELLELPKKFEKFQREFKEFREKDFKDLQIRVESLERDVAELKQDVAVLKQDVAELKQDVAELKQDVAELKKEVTVLKKDMSYVKGELGRLKGREFERTVREKYYAFFGRILKRSKLIPFEEILSLIDDAEEQGVITESERDSILRLDLLVKGRLKTTDKEVILAVEVSYSLKEDDIERASVRADSLYRILKTEIIPTVVSAEFDDSIEKLAEERGILIIKADFEY